MDDFELDDHLGGEEVAVRVKGLTMERSRMDGHLNVAAGLGYCEWTTVFRNVAAVAREARFQVQLPPGAVASRVTLVGERRAAGGGLRLEGEGAGGLPGGGGPAAARPGAGDGLRAGPDPGAVFPGAADGGEMKIRVGITAPLVEGRMEFPKVLERNFAVAEGLEHAVWMQSDVPFEVAGAGDGVAVEDGGGYSCQIGVPYVELVDKFVVANNGKPEKQVYCIDPFAPVEERVLTLTRGGRDVAAVDACVVVIDGSVGMAPHRSGIAAALQGLGERKNLTVLMADDGVREVEPGALGRERVLAAGGTTCRPCWRRCGGPGRWSDGVVVWVHAAQPLKSPKMDLIEQLYARGAKQVPLVSVPVAAGGEPGPRGAVQVPGRAGRAGAWWIWSGTSRHSSRGSSAGEREVEPRRGSVARTNRRACRRCRTNWRAGGRRPRCGRPTGVQTADAEARGLCGEIPARDGLLRRGGAGDRGAIRAGRAGAGRSDFGAERAGGARAERLVAAGAGRDGRDVAAAARMID